MPRRILLFFAFALASCGDVAPDADSEDARAGDTDVADATSADGSLEVGSDTGAGEPTMPVCSAPNTCEGDALSCRPLFGRPAANTGLGEGECGPVCACEGEAWSVPDYDQAFVDALRAWTPVEPASPSEDDPYSREPRPAPRPELFCGFIVEDRAAQTYRLETFDSLGALEQAGARLTHTGACGTCSTLRDLAVYIGTPDLTTPVRECGLRGLSESQDAARACLEEIGFSSACADTWGYNAAHTAVVCLSDCLALLDAPFHTEDGAPNACIQCDEDQSGPVFKAVAGRTRRNSGLPTALCRPCDTVAAISHALP